MKILNNGLNKNNKKPFILPFVASQLPWTNKFMTNEFICKKALGTLFRYSHIIALKALVLHAKNHTLPIHGLTGRVDSFSAKFQENVVPSLAPVSKNEIVPLAGARPTWYTRDTVTCTTIERDTIDILELDPGVSKSSLYKEYAYLHGWKIETTAKWKIIKTSRYDEAEEEQ